MKRMSDYLLCVGLLLALFTFAVAQDDEKKWLPPAMADIGLTAEQKAKIKPVVLEQRKQAKAIREDAALDAAAKQEKLRPINKAANDQFKAILTPEQWTKFQEARKAMNEKNQAAKPADKKP
jgi:Spy/CpxP family protein refolding chaperone